MGTQVVQKARTIDTFLFEKPTDNHYFYKTKQLIVSEHPLEILSKRYILRKIKEYKHNFGSEWISRLKNLQLPWYCDRKKFNQMMIHIYSIVQVVCVKKYIGRDTQVILEKAQKIKKEMPLAKKKEYLNPIVKRVFQRRRGNTHTRKIADILDFPILEEILEYATNPIYVRNYKSLPLQSKNTMVANALETEVEKEVVESSFCSNDSISKKKELILRLRRAILRVYNFFLVGKGRKSSFGALVQNYCTRMTFDKLQNNISNIEGQKRDKISELYFTTFMVKNSILLMNIGESLKQKNPNLSLKKRVIKRLIEIIKIKNNLSSIEQLLDKDYRRQSYNLFKESNECRKKTNKLKLAIQKEQNDNDSKCEISSFEEEESNKKVSVSKRKQVLSNEVLKALHKKKRKLKNRMIYQSYCVTEPNKQNSIFGLLKQPGVHLELSKTKSNFYQRKGSFRSCTKQGKTLFRKASYGQLPYDKKIIVTSARNTGKNKIAKRHNRSREHLKTTS